MCNYWNTSSLLGIYNGAAGKSTHAQGNPLQSFRLGKLYNTGTVGISPWEYKTNPGSRREFLEFISRGIEKFYIQRYLVKPATDWINFFSKKRGFLLAISLYPKVINPFLKKEKENDYFFPVLAHVHHCWGVAQFSDNFYILHLSSPDLWNALGPIQVKTKGETVGKKGDKLMSLSEKIGTFFFNSLEFWVRTRIDSYQISLPALPSIMNPCRRKIRPLEFICREIWVRETEVVNFD